MHGETLADARNAGAQQAVSRWLCFVDADDELEPGYLEALTGRQWGDLRAPAVRYVTPGAPVPPPIVLADRNIMRMNPCVIGTLIPAGLFADAGGFWHEPAWEDWSLFRRCAMLGASIVHEPSAVYRAHVNSAGRNSTVKDPQLLHRWIAASHSEWYHAKKKAGLV